MIIFVKTKKQNNMKNTFVLGLIAGAVVGGALGLLFAPKKGEETRKDIKDTIDNLANKGKDFYEKKFKSETTQQQQI